MSTQNRPFVLVPLPISKTRARPAGADARLEQPGNGHNVIPFPTRSNSHPPFIAPRAQKHPTPIWQHDPTLIAMALGMCAGNVGRAANLLETWQGATKPIGRSEKR